MTTSSVQHAPEQAEQRPQPDVNKPVEPVVPPKRQMMIIASAIILIVVGIIIWRVFFATPSLPDSIIAVSGRIEGDDSAVASKTTGRILEVRVRENQARATLLEAEAKAKAAQEQIAVLKEQLQQSQLQVGQSKLDTEGRVRQAEAELATAQSELAQQDAAYQIAAFDKDAYTRLAKSGAVSERQGLQAATTANQQAAAVAASKRRVEAAQAALTSAQGSLSNPSIRESQVALVRRQISQQGAEVASAAAQTAQARAQLAEAEANRQDLTVRAPFSGTVVTRAAEPGEVVTAGTAIITLVDLNKVYLRGFVPEGQIGKVKAGQPARVYLDSNPQQPVDAYVSRIDPQATFTPENTYFRDDRVKQVVGLKLQLKGGFGFAKPGMPADGEILVSGNTWPKVSRR